MSDPIENFLLLIEGLVDISIQIFEGIIEAYKAIPDRVLKELEVE